ncbi:MAG: DUF2141 domain-containing protein [Leptolyngbyaceae cyanobacterium bins.59]|nr:DUF2141 domain-containing protein [Leptolyngbyaceae cyanobacterium bins.59]
MAHHFLVSVASIAVLSSLFVMSGSPANANPRQTVAAKTGQLTVAIEGLKTMRGQVCFSLFASNRGFPSDSKRAVQSQCIQIGTAPLEATFNQLPAGTYAVAVLHDINSDGAMNQGAFGIPTEGFGFSRNPAVRTSPPSFGDAAVVVAGPSTNIRIQLRYLF